MILCFNFNLVHGKSINSSPCYRVPRKKEDVLRETQEARLGADVGTVVRTRGGRRAGRGREILG